MYTSNFNRSIKPPTKPITESQRRMFQNVKDVLSEQVDDDVILLVLNECSWKGEEATDKLLSIAESKEEQKTYESKLKNIAEGLCGILNPKENGSSQHISSSSLSASEKIIRRPIKSPSSTKAVEGEPLVSSLTDCLSSVGSKTVQSAVETQKGNVTELDVHLTQLSSKSMEPNVLSALTLNSASQNALKIPLNQPSPSSDTSKTRFYPNASLTANNQPSLEHFDRKGWENYLSGHDPQDIYYNRPMYPSKSSPAFRCDSLNLLAELDKPNTGNGRSFPVRLLSQSPEDVEKVPEQILKQITHASSYDYSDVSKTDMYLDSDHTDLDNTVFKCIYEIQGDLLDKKELSRHSTLSPASEPGLTGHSKQPTPFFSSEPMTLPVIGLSVNAAEFVPRSKPCVTTTSQAVVSTVANNTPLQAIPRSVEIDGFKNPKMTSPASSLSSELCPSLCTPDIRIGSPTTNLTGTPMFITPKWYNHTALHGPAQIQPELTTTPPRYIGQDPGHQFVAPRGYRLASSRPLTYPTQIVYTIASSPVFHMAGIQTPSYVPAANLQKTNNTDERVAAATGQPILATSDIYQMGQPTVPKKLCDLMVDKIKKQQHSKFLIILRGLPGSGKSTLARSFHFGSVVLSTDDYFKKANTYQFNANNLSEAHNWTKERVKKAMEKGKSPVIIDNTNTQIWEMKPYVELALVYKYEVMIMEPDTPWKFNVNELAKRTVHEVSKDTIQRMFDRYEYNVTVDTVLRTHSEPSFSDIAKSENKMNSHHQSVNWSTHEQAVIESNLMSSNSSPLAKSVLHAAKDNRLHNLVTEDLFKQQKSADSDSDSLSTETSSYVSEPWSNHSSRNVSPKPFRQTFKAPSSLQRNDKSKLIPTKISTANPSGMVNSLQEIIDLEAKLSAETVQIVNDMINEHGKDKTLSNDEIDRLDGELKALLVINIINEVEMQPAERLISLKLHNLFQYPTCIAQCADFINDTCKSSAKDSVQQPTFVIEQLDWSLGNKTVITGNPSDSNQESKEKLIPNKIFSSSDEITYNVSFNLDANEEVAVSQAQFQERADPIHVIQQNILSSSNQLLTTNLDPIDANRPKLSWKQIGGNQESLSIKDVRSLSDGNGFDEAYTNKYLSAVISNQSESLLKNVDSTTEFELQYWKQLSGESIVVDDMEIADVTWSAGLVQKWDEPAVSNETNLKIKTQVVTEAKPQRVRRHKRRCLQNHDSAKSSQADLNNEQFDMPSDISIEFQLDKGVDSDIKTGVNTDNKLAANDENISVENFNEINTNNALSNNSENNYHTTEKTISHLFGSKQNYCNDLLTNNSSQSEVSIIQEREESNHLTEINENNFGDIKTNEESCKIMNDAALIEYQKSAIKNDMPNCFINTDPVDAHVFGVDNNHSLPKQSSSIGSLQLLMDSYNDFDSDNESKEDINNAIVKVLVDNCLAMDHAKLSTQDNDRYCSDNTIFVSSVIEEGKLNSAVEHSVPGVQPASSKNQKHKTSKRNNDNSYRSLFESHVRDKCMNSDWTSLAFTSETLDKEQVVCVQKNVISSDVETMTEPHYFMVVSKLSQGEFVDSKIKYRTPNKNKVISQLNGNSKDRNDHCANKKESCYLNKSTSSDDLTTNCDKINMDFLHNFFPKVPIDELKCTLDICADNVELAINMILGGIFISELSDDDDIKMFADERARDKNCQTLENVKSNCSDTHSNPISLLDLCIEKIEHENTTTREELEMQMIQTGKERLDMIEDNMTKKMLSRSTSINEAYLDSSDQSGVHVPVSSDLPLRAEEHLNEFDALAMVYGQIDSDSSYYEQTVNYQRWLCENSDFKKYKNSTGKFIEKGANVDTRKDNTGCEPYLMKRDRGSASKALPFVDHRPTGNSVPKGALASVSFIAESGELEMLPTLTMSVDEGLIVKLEEMFGPINNRIQVNNNVRIPIDHRTAWLLYQCLQQGLLHKDVMLQQQQLREDEELAKKLQEQENLPDKFAVNRQNISCCQQHAKSTKVHQTLADIMREEQIIQEKQDSFDRFVRQEGLHTMLATKMKRRKLFEMFPTIDETVLDEIFQTNCFNLTETIKVIQASIAGYPMSSAFTVQADDQSDKQTIEDAKQQSVQTMLDNGISHPAVGMDFQDGNEPGYEDFRGEANLHHRLRQECFQKASEAYKKGLKQVATFYSQQGHKHTKKLKEANMKASECILMKRNSDLEKNHILDLHGLHVDEAVAALKRIIPQKEAEQCRLLIIVTGKGNHSQGGVSRLRLTVEAYLNRLQYKFTETQAGVFRVNLMHHAV